MTEAETIHGSYLREGAVFPFCKGCGHHHYVHHLDEALRMLQIDPSHVAIVSDIGCIGILDSLFAAPHTFHTTHGRSTAFASGIELADSILYDSKLKSIVVIGDGGSMIGLLHIITAALMNLDVTVLLANNFLFGMTGGQNSNFSPLGFVTPTSPAGNIVPPVDICAFVESCGAGYVARCAASDKQLSSIIAKAIAYPGFALVEILELCTEYAVRGNQLDGKKIVAAAESKQPLLSPERTGREEFSKTYTETILRGAPSGKVDKPIKRNYRPKLQGTTRLVIAGTAGEKVQRASYLLLRGAMMSGLHATQKNDNPVTQGSGFSISEVCLSVDEVFFTGIEHPDVLVILSVEGLAEVRSGGVLDHVLPGCLIVMDESLPEIGVPGKIVRLPLRRMCTPKRAAVVGLAAVLLHKDIFPAEALFDAIEEYEGERVLLYRKNTESVLDHLRGLSEKRGNS